MRSLSLASSRPAMMDDVLLREIRSTERRRADVTSGLLDDEELVAVDLGLCRSISAARARGDKAADRADLGSILFSVCEISLSVGEDGERFGVIPRSLWTRRFKRLSFVPDVSRPRF